jgi:hypothetical protein
LRAERLVARARAHRFLRIRDGARWALRPVVARAPGADVAVVHHAPQVGQVRLVPEEVPTRCRQHE